MRYIVLIILALTMLSSASFAQNSGGNTADMIVPLSWGRLIAVVPTEVGQLLYFEAPNGEINIIAQLHDLGKIIKSVYTIKRN